MSARVLRRGEALWVGAAATLVSAVHAIPPWGSYRGGSGLVKVKGLHPLTHFATSLGDTSHEAKVDFRLVVPLILRPLGASYVVSAVLFALCGVVTFAVLAEELRRSDIPARLIVLSIGGLAATAAGGVFLLTLPFFDAVAIALVVLAGFVPGPFTAGTLGLLALYSDERALLALPLWLLVGRWLDGDRAVRHPRGLSTRVLIVVFALYVISRVVLEIATDLRTVGGHVGFDVAWFNKRNWPFAVLGAFSAWWVVLVLGGWLAVRRRRLIDAALTCSAGAVLVAAILVFDVTRSVSYLLPLAPVPVVAAARALSPRITVRLFGAVFVACMLIPAYVFTGPGVLYKWLPVRLLSAIGAW